MTRSRVLLSVALGALPWGCGDRPAPSEPAAAVDISRAQPGEVLRLDDYPLYYMRSSSDYGFDSYRRGTAGARGAATAPRADALPGRSTWACTCFATAPSGEGPLFGRNFDWRNRASLLLYTTPPNALASLSMVDLHYVDFSATVGLDELRAQRDRIAQRAPYYPFDGLNERGVAIGLMAVPSAQPPFDPGKVSLYDLALIRLVLDYAGDTNHAVDLLRGCNYRATSPPVHFLIADSSGTAALVEYVAGEMKVTRSTTAFMVATNFVVFGSQAPFSTGCPRYDRAHSTLAARNGILSRAEALDLLSTVSQDITMWSAVYDLGGRGVEVVPGRRYDRSYRFAMDAGR
jgi:linear amide C-N hydrolase (choloylglycine hydrolase family)